MSTRRVSARFQRGRLVLGDVVAHEDDRDAGAAQARARCRRSSAPSRPATTAARRRRGRTAIMRLTAARHVSGFTESMRYSVCCSTWPSNAGSRSLSPGKIALGYWRVNESASTSAFSAKARSSMVVCWAMPPRNGSTGPMIPTLGRRTTTLAGLLGVSGLGFELHAARAPLDVLEQLAVVADELGEQPEQRPAGRRRGCRIAVRMSDCRWPWPAPVEVEVEEAQPDEDAERAEDRRPGT